jgi:hypothetical protein
VVIFLIKNRQDCEFSIQSTKCLDIPAGKHVFL